MAFSSIVDDSRRMNAKMIAMGQSVDIQKMPRPKPGTQTAQRQAMYTPSGSDVEKMLYPKNFKARVFEESAPASNSEISAPKEGNGKELEKAQEIISAAMEEEQAAPKIIGDEDTEPEAPQAEERVATAKPFPRNSWESCKHYKKQGNRAFCREYLGWCAEGKCARPKY
ncbi:Uncharacterised protein [uncultured archaeon]|nr:Uncharacterised protein [uncultured archaeon]